MKYPQTIQIFLPDGDPQGIRVASITTRIMRVFDVPRSALARFLTMDEAAQVGIYFLFGEGEEDDLPMAYIGQTGSLRDRLASHQKSKEFWNRALVAVSLTNNLTNTHASYLESLSIQRALDTGRYSLENGNGGSRPHVPPPLEAECLEIHDTLRTLLATLGYPLFEPLIKRSREAIAEASRQADDPPDEGADSELLFCTGSGANGMGRYTDDGFVVLQGSTGRFDTTDSFNPHNARLRKALFEKGILSKREDRIYFERDHLFRKPSPAAACLMGRPANGMIEWKNSAGTSLGELIRRG